MELNLAELGDALGFLPLAAYWATKGQSSGEKARRDLGWSRTRTDPLATLASGGA